MKRAWLFALVLGCGGDDGGVDARPVDAAAGADGSGNAAPVISRVRWMPAAGCTAGVSSDFAFVIEATDAETPGELTYDGSVSSCTGRLDRAMDSVTCPNVSPYLGSVTVRDPQGAMAMLSFTVSPCAAGSASP
jgi:hypothetical protein